MSYIDKIKACNNYTPSHFIPFLVDGVEVGACKPEFAKHLARWPDIFHVDTESVSLCGERRSFEERSRLLDGVIEQLLARNIIHRRHGEAYPVTADSRENALFLIDRASVSYFGVRAFGQHMNGYVRDGKTLKMWVARRSMSKWHEPGKLDNMVAGGAPYGISLEKNLEKECWEEAAIPAELAAKARETGTVSYCAETAIGLKPDTIYCYDLELPPGFTPRCMDGEVERFELRRIEEVAEIVCKTDDFKKNSSLVIIDFLIRHGIIRTDHPDHGELLAGLIKGGPLL